MKYGQNMDTGRSERGDNRLNDTICRIPGGHPERSRLDVSVLVAGQEVARSAACGHGPHGLELSSPVSGITKVTVDGSVG